MPTTWFESTNPYAAPGEIDHPRGPSPLAVVREYLIGAEPSRRLRIEFSLFSGLERYSIDGHEVFRTHSFFGYRRFRVPGEGASSIVVHVSPMGRVRLWKDQTLIETNAMATVQAINWTAVGVIGLLLLLALAG